MRPPASRAASAIWETTWAAHTRSSAAPRHLVTAHGVSKHQVHADRGLVGQSRADAFSFEHCTNRVDIDGCAESTCDAKFARQMPPPGPRIVLGRGHQAQESTDRHAMLSCGYKFGIAFWGRETIYEVGIFSLRYSLGILLPGSQ